jgi:hypothetical protein
METEWDNGDDPGSAQPFRKGTTKTGRRLSRPGRSLERASIIIPCLGKSLPVSLAVDVYAVHRGGSFQLTDNVLNAAPLSKPGLDSYASEIDLPIVSLVGGNNLKLVAGPDEANVGAICPITASIDIAFNMAFSYPEKWTDDNGVEHVDGVRDQVAIATVLVPRVIIRPGYSFNIVNGAISRQIVQWRPALIGLFFDHPESLQFTGAEANAVLANPRVPGSQVYPIAAVERHVIIAGTVTGYDFKRNGGFAYSDISLTVCNILEADNADQAALKSAHKITHKTPFGFIGSLDVVDLSLVSKVGLVRRRRRTPQSLEENPAAVHVTETALTTVAVTTRQSG